MFIDLPISQGHMKQKSEAPLNIARIKL